MSQTDVQGWTKAIQVVLHKKYWKYTNDIIINFKLVDLGLKPSFLWDLFVTDKNCILQLVEALQHSHLLDSHNVVIFIANEIFIANKAVVITMFDNIFCKRDKKVMIDASDSLTIPKLLEQETNLDEISKNIRDALQRAECESALEIAVQSHWCVPTLFGLLLGYPVVYCLNSDSNCLGGVPLCVYKIQGTFKKMSKLHTLYSFSIPQCLHQNLDSQIKLWYKKNVECINQSHFSSIQLLTEFVVQPHVIM
jgi:hypothetical protein